MSHVNEILLLERYDDQAVKRIAAQMGHKADHWVHPTYHPEAWPILSQKVVSPIYKGTSRGPTLGALPGSDKPASQEFHLHEPEKSDPGQKPGWGGGGFAPLHSLEKGKNTRLTVHEYKGHHFYLWRDENPRQSVGKSYAARSAGTENSLRLYGSQEGFEAVGIPASGKNQKTVRVR
jgi:hypothetical protein